jgi:hypothetical protein
MEHAAVDRQDVGLTKLDRAATEIAGMRIGTLAPMDDLCRT